MFLIHLNSLGIGAASDYMLLQHLLSQEFGMLLISNIIQENSSF